MSKPFITQVVIFIFIDGQKVLMEKRLLKDFTGEQLLVPGGRVKVDEKDLEVALKREAMEELGVTPLAFTPLPESAIDGLGDSKLFPFVIHKWEGMFPDIVLDRGNSLVWVEIEEALKSEVIPTRKIIQALKGYLALKNDPSKIKII